MAADTPISWCDDTVNPWWGCTWVSPACDHCYAERLSRRFDRAGWGPSAERWLRVHRAQLDLDKIARRAIRSDRARCVFIASMSDFFEDRARLVDPRGRFWAHLFHHADHSRLTDGRPALVPLLLTKRPGLALEWARWTGWPEGAWLGVTAEDQRRADERVPVALAVKAVTGCRVFVSCEPLLGPLDLSAVGGREFTVNALSPDPGASVDWVICGGESGPGARPMHPEWARSLRDQCEAAGIPYHFKQWGEWKAGIRSALPVGVLEKHGAWHPGTYRYGPPWAPGCVAWNGNIQDRRTGATAMVRVGKRAAGRLLDGRTHDDRPGDLEVTGE